MTRIKHAADYREKRREDYPAIGDQLDQLWRVIDTLRARGTQLPAEAEAMLTQIQATKTRYPRPPS